MISRGPIKLEPNEIAYLDSEGSITELDWIAITALRLCPDVNKRRLLPDDGAIESVVKLMEKGDRNLPEIVAADERNRAGLETTDDTRNRRKHTTPQLRSTPCLCCGFPLTARHHFAFYYGPGQRDNEYTVQLCGSCHDTFHTLVRRLLAAAPPMERPSKERIQIESLRQDYDPDRQTDPDIAALIGFAPCATARVAELIRIALRLRAHASDEVNAQEGLESDIMVHGVSEWEGPVLFMRTDQEPIDDPWWDTEEEYL